MNMFPGLPPVTQKTGRRRAMMTLFAGYPDTQFWGTRAQSVAVYTEATGDCSLWAVTTVIEAFCEGRRNGTADPNYCPSAALLAVHARKFDEARRAFDGDRLGSVLGRLRCHAIDALPTPDQVRLARDAQPHASEAAKKSGDA